MHAPFKMGFVIVLAWGFYVWSPLPAFCRFCLFEGDDSRLLGFRRFLDAFYALGIFSLRLSFCIIHGVHFWCRRSLPASYSKSSYTMGTFVVRDSYAVCSDDYRIYNFAIVFAAF